MSKFVAGNVVEQHSNFNFQNCVACGKSLGKNTAEILVDGDNRLITAEQYDDLMNRGSFASTYTIGSTCVNKFASEVVA